jgi:hypothetical protein
MSREQQHCQPTHRIAKLAVAILLLAILAADRPQTPTSAKQALTLLQGFVGDWRGVGQVRRGSTRDAWREECGWAWKFDDEEPSLTFKIDDAKYLRDGSLQWNSESKRYELAAHGVQEGQSVKYIGQLDESGKLILEASEVPASLPARLSFRQVAGGDRLIVLYERRSGTKRFLRMAEVGYTRSGSNFGKGTTFVECVVTGGVGTIQVRYQGQTYYVCCTGCKDYFDADPAGVLAEYREQKAEEKRKAKEKSQKQG